jgi:hypothetical protein
MVRIPSCGKHVDAEDENGNKGNAHQDEEELLLAGHAHAKSGQYNPDTIQAMQDARGHD